MISCKVQTSFAVTYGTLKKQLSKEINK